MNNPELMRQAVLLCVLFFVLLNIALRLCRTTYRQSCEGWPLHPELTVRQVTDYLLKRGFTQTEEVFRKESSNLGPDGKPIHQKVEEMGPKKYVEAFSLLNDWIENNLDLYKVCVPQLIIIHG